MNHLSGEKTSMRFFNTAGPIQPDIHYHVPPLTRLDVDNLILLIRQRKYFVLHAPRQTGKTSALLALRDRLNAGDEFRCVYVNVEVGQSAREDVAAAMRAVLSALALSAGDPFLEETWQEDLVTSGPHMALQRTLVRWSESIAQPLVLLIDEIDALVGDTLISVLRQLRAGYPERPGRFLQSVILCGVRDVRDYRIHSAVENTIIAGGSAFNVRAESLRLGDFSEDEVDALLLQHTRETAQEITDEARTAIRDLTKGQPWLVNALAYEACFGNTDGRDRKCPITVEAIHDAREQLILRRETHLDQLTDKLREERVRRVIEPLLSGGAVDSISPDDLQYTRDLGLVGPGKPPAIANPIYLEVIPRDLTFTTQEMMIHDDPAWYIGDDGSLLMDKLLRAFQAFFREHSEHWVERFQYREAGPQLLLQAFLQRIVNSGGRIEREYGLGRRRTDLLIIWPMKGRIEGYGSPGRSGQSAGSSQSGQSAGSDGSESAESAESAAGNVPAPGTQKVVVECKVLHKGPEPTLREGLSQTRDYMDRCAASEGHLVLFDRSEGRSWSDKIFRRDISEGGATVTVWGL